MSDPVADEVLDMAVIEQLRVLERGLRPGVVAQLFNVFLSSSQDLLRRMEEGVRFADNEAVRVAAHTLKSSARGVGARQVADRSALIEDAAREGHEPARLAESLNRLRQEHAAACRALAAIVN
jgi:HPt (histidine-containing phosphotransfer) domain-containing protein